MLFPGFVQYSSQHFLSNFRQAFSPCTLLALMWCFYRAVLIRPLLEKHCVLSYWIGLTSIWPISYRYLLIPSLVAYWWHFPLMRRCFRGRWNCPQVSETYRLVWRCRLIDLSTCTLFCLSWLRSLCRQLPFPNNAAGVHPETLCRPRM